jgi:hypothetical protein
MRILGTDIISIQKTSGFFIEKFILFLFIYFRYIISMAIGKVQLPYEFRGMEKFVFGKLQIFHCIFLFFSAKLKTYNCLADDGR